MAATLSLLLLMVPAVMAADIASLTAAIDIFYYMFCGCIVFLMQLGFAMVEVVDRCPN